MAEVASRSPTREGRTAVPARRMLSVVVVVALPPALGAGGYALGADAQSDAAPTREALAQVVKPPGAPGRTLGLSRVTIPARTALTPHRHPGDQIAYIEHGTPYLHRPDRPRADLPGRRRRL